MDNAFVAQEIIHYMSKSSARHMSLAFKIDLEKAYGSVSWGFLRYTLTLFDFPQKVVDLITCCVSYFNISLLGNGNRLPPFKPGRGLRKGDPFVSLFICDNYGASLSVYLAIG